MREHAQAWDTTTGSATHTMHRQQGATRTRMHTHTHTLLSSTSARRRGGRSHTSLARNCCRPGGCLSCSRCRLRCCSTCAAAHVAWCRACVHAGWCVMQQHAGMRATQGTPPRDRRQSRCQPAPHPLCLPLLRLELPELPLLLLLRLHARRHILLRVVGAQAGTQHAARRRARAPRGADWCQRARCTCSGHARSHQLLP
jgi:hypothetical protein